MYEKSIEIRTERLKVVCVGLDEMLMLKKGNQEDQFIRKMGYTIHKVEGLDKDLNDEFCSLALEYPDSSLWFRLWDIVSVKDNLRIGGALFKGGPNDKGEVEIGYGIDDDFQGMGYATEAIGCIVSWALNQKNVEAVIAETEKDNIPSIKVMEHIGMNHTFQTESAFWWSSDSISK